MSKHEEKSCPRCHRNFICRSGDISRCQCYEVKVSAELREFLSDTQYDCLCRDCLTDLNNLLKASGNYHFPTQKEMFMEGIHYYKEDDKWVFTEMYHLLRGYCCQSGCRHCIYGFRK